MRWGTVPTIQQQVRRYLDSVGIIEAYRARHPEHVFVFQLDRIEPTPEARQQEVHRLFAFLEEEVVDDVSRFAHEWRPAQTSARHHDKTGGGELLIELPPDEQTYLDRHADYQTVMRRYGY
jgi:hypothetical protein